MRADRSRDTFLAGVAVGATMSLGSARPKNTPGAARRGVARLDIPRLQESSRQVQHLLVLGPGNVLAIDRTSSQAGVEDTDPAVGELARRLGVGFPAGP